MKNQKIFTKWKYFLLEIARDHYRSRKEENVIGGIVSPVHDSYKKPNVELSSSEHRCKMIKLSIQSSDWIRASTWECKRKQWSPTLEVLQYHQVSFWLNFMNLICIIVNRLKHIILELSQFHTER